MSAWDRGAAYDGEKTATGPYVVATEVFDGFVARSWRDTSVTSVTAIPRGQLQSARDRISDLQRQLYCCRQKDKTAL